MASLLLAASLLSICAATGPSHGVCGYQELEGLWDGERHSIGFHQDTSMLTVPARSLSSNAISYGGVSSNQNIGLLGEPCDDAVNQSVEAAA